MPKISVIVPVYNMEKYLEECLDSIIAQTLSDIEIICINDGSKDNSLPLLKDYAAKDSRIIIIDKENEGVGKARNDGIRSATGEFIAFMDSDDYYPSIFALERLYETAIKYNVKVAGGSLLYLLPNGTFDKEPECLEKYGISFSKKQVDHFVNYQYDYGYTKYIFSRQMLVENNIVFPPIKRFQDPVFFVSAMEKADLFACIEDDVYCYRRIRTPSKYCVSNTVDFFRGLCANLEFSRSHGMAKLHYLSAMRLNKEGSFMATKNLFDDRRNELISAIIKTVNLVDTEWLRENGFDIPADFVPEVFEYAISTAEKYEKFRNSKPGKLISKLKK